MKISGYEPDYCGSDGVLTGNIEVHGGTHDTRHWHLPTNSDSSDSETIESTSVAAREPVTDPDIFSRLVDVLYPFLLAVYVSSVNANFGSLNADQLAQAEAFAHTSVNTWGNVSLEAWNVRLHQILQANSPSDPLDPRAEVYDMICKASSSKDNTDSMLVLSNSVCLTQKCGITLDACLTSSGTWRTWRC
jgi:hypothetical protein